MSKKPNRTWKLFTWDGKNHIETTSEGYPGESCIEAEYPSKALKICGLTHPEYVSKTRKSGIFVWHISKDIHYHPADFYLKEIVEGGEK